MSKTKTSRLIFCENCFVFRVGKRQFLYLRYSVAVMSKKESRLEVDCYGYILETAVSLTRAGVVCTVEALKSG